MTLHKQTVTSHLSMKKTFHLLLEILLLFAYEKLLVTAIL
jgi:hypothetical protein